MIIKSEIKDRTEYYETTAFIFKNIMILNWIVNTVILIVYYSQGSVLEKTWQSDQQENLENKRWSELFSRMFDVYWKRSRGAQVAASL